MSSLAEKKRQLRTEIKRRRAALSPEERKILSLAICRKLLESELFRGARTIFFFASFGTEVETFPALGEALLRGRRVALPRTLLGERRLVFHQVFTLGELVPGPYGILEPPRKNPVIPPEEADLILVPGLAFDRQGYRLGYGGGFYDRFLAGLSAPRVALAFSFQILPEIPHEPHDLRVDLIFTEEDLIAVSERDFGKASG